MILIVYYLMELVELQFTITILWIVGYVSIVYFLIKEPQHRNLQPK
jgi:hypothetical protein